MAHARVDDEGRRTSKEIERLVSESLEQACQSERGSGPQSPDNPWHSEQRDRMTQLIGRLGLLDPIGNE